MAKRYYYQTSYKDRCGCRCYSNWKYTEKYTSKAALKKAMHLGEGRRIEILTAEQVNAIENEKLKAEILNAWEY